MTTNGVAPRLSISLPSIYEKACIRALKNLRDATVGSYEVILVSPFPPPKDCDENVIWIEEKEGTGNGCNAGHAAAWKAMRGEYVMPWVDDHFVVDGFDVLAIDNYNEREAVFAKRSKTVPFLLGLRHNWPFHVGTQFGMYYPYFPFARRSRLADIGWFDPIYEKGFADGDLAMRVWDSGGRCEWSDLGLVTVHMEDDNRKAGVMFSPSDLDTFVERWAPKYGKGWNTSDLRGFNIDIEPDHFPALVENNTITQNDPKFREILVAGGWRVYS
jgi:hypothetical protein